MIKRLLPTKAGLAFRGIALLSVLETGLLMISRPLSPFVHHNCSHYLQANSWLGCHQPTGQADHAQAGCSECAMPRAKGLQTEVSGVSPAASTVVESRHFESPALTASHIVVRGDRSCSPGSASASCDRRSRLGSAKPVLRPQHGESATALAVRQNAGLTNLVGDGGQPHAYVIRQRRSLPARIWAAK